MCVKQSIKTCTLNFEACIKKRRAYHTRIIKGRNLKHSISLPCRAKGKKRDGQHSKGKGNWVTDEVRKYFPIGKPTSRPARECHAIRLVPATCETSVKLAKIASISVRVAKHKQLANATIRPCSDKLSWEISKNWQTRDSRISSRDWSHPWRKKPRRRRRRRTSCSISPWRTEFRKRRKEEAIFIAKMGVVTLGRIFFYAFLIDVLINLDRGLRVFTHFQSAGLTARSTE